jgi:hypothetical protein
MQLWPGPLSTFKMTRFPGVSSMSGKRGMMMLLMEHILFDAVNRCDAAHFIYHDKQLLPNNHLAVELLYLHEQFNGKDEQFEGCFGNDFLIPSRKRLTPKHVIPNVAVDSRF